MRTRTITPVNGGEKPGHSLRHQAIEALEKRTARQRRIGKAVGSLDDSPEEAAIPRGKRGERITIEMPRTNFITVEIVGDSPLHVHAMSAKTAIQLEESASGKDDAKINKRKRPPKDPWNDFCNALHLMPGKDLPWKSNVSKLENGVPRLPYPIGYRFPFYKETFGFPVAGIGKGIRQILQNYGYSKIERAGIWIKPISQKFGQLMPLFYDELIFERVPCRVGPYKVADMHYRGMFVNWSTRIVVEYDEDLIDPNQLINAIQRAGRYCGLGEQRKSSPQNPGDEGMYHVRTKS